MITEIILCCQLTNDLWWKILSGLMTVFATFISVGYLLRPRLYYCAYLEHNSILIKIMNQNHFFTIKDIKCEVALSKTATFDRINTLELKKDFTLMIKRSCPDNNDYVFLTTSSYNYSINAVNAEIDMTDKMNKVKKYEFLRVRLLAPNFLGVKKHYERYYTALELINAAKEKQTHCQCWHSINTNEVFKTVEKPSRCKLWNALRSITGC